MSQVQPQRPEETQERYEQTHRDPVKYGDVFHVTGDLAKEPIAPEDAVVMQRAEAVMFGQVQHGGPAEVMGGAAVVNQRIGVDREMVADKDVTVTTTDYPGGRVVTESVGGQVVGQYFQAAQKQITIGEALEAAARVCGDKPVDRSDAASIQEAEALATGSAVTTPGGVAATAISAASFNAGMDKDEDKIKLSYVLADATVKLPADRVATRQDADRVAGAEQRNNLGLTINAVGVASAVATAVRLNEGGA